MKILGQFNLGFIIAELNGDLFILDQHACDEKFKYVVHIILNSYFIIPFRFENLQEHTTIHQQPLIHPLILELSAAEEMSILENIQVFEYNGFKISIDEDSPPGKKISIVSIPFSKSIEFGINDARELASILSDQSEFHIPVDINMQYSTPSLLLKNRDNKNDSQLLRLPKIVAMFASRACRSAVMIGKALNSNEMTSIVENLSTIENPWNCPHGRPTLRHLLDLNSLLVSQNDDHLDRSIFKYRI